MRVSDDDKSYAEGTHNEHDDLVARRRSKRSEGRLHRQGDTI